MIVYLSLGSNLGDRIGTIQQAVQMLTSHPQVKLLSTSSFYETEPVGLKEQPWFINVAIAVETDLTPHALMELCLVVEQKLGRVRNPESRFGPRTIDIDMLMYGSLVLETESLTLPHPRLHERACVLVPLLEINSRLVHPILKQSVEQMHHHLAAPEDVRLYGSALSI